MTLESRQNFAHLCPIGSELIPFLRFPLRILDPVGIGVGGVIAVDRGGNLAMPDNTVGMVRGVTSSELAPTVPVY